MHTRIITAPTIWPLTLTEVKLHLKLAVSEDEAEDYTDEDTLLNIYLKAATESAEEYCWRKFLSTGLQSVTTSLCRAVHLPFPASAVATVKYYDSSDVAQTISSTEYYLDNYSLPSRVIFKGTFSYPTLSTDRPFPVEFNYTAGYGPTAASVPLAIKNAILLMIGELYEKREDRVFKLPTASQCLLNPHRLWKF